MSKFSNMKLRYKVALASGVGAAAIAGGGLAFAAWSTSGSGSGSATAYTNKTSTVTASGTAADSNLYPGDNAVPVHFTVNNPNPYSVTFTTFSGASISGVSGGIGGSPACAVGNFSLSSTSGSLDSSVVAASGDTADAGSATILKMNSDAPNSCQGVTVTVGLSIQGAQS